MVKYCEGFPDQFFHRFSYDEDNRITKVETSIDRIIWDQDANYHYYDHGPLRRVELGEDDVQGIDFTYTIHGWLKAINHSSLNPTKDPGLDDGTTFGEDAFGMNLGYYDGDFTRSNSYFNENFDNTLLSVDANRDLYNGNISAWTT